MHKDRKTQLLFATQSRLIIKRSKGAYFYDEQHKKYLDFSLSGGRHILGHNHPKLTKAIKNQISKTYSHEHISRVSIQCIEKILDLYRHEFPLICFHHTLPDLYRCLQEQHQGEILFYGRHYQHENPHTTQIITEATGIGQIRHKIRHSEGKIRGLCLERFEGPPFLRGHSEDFIEQIKELKKEHSLTIILDEQRSTFFSTSDYQRIPADIIILPHATGGGFPLYGILSKGSRGGYRHTQSPNSIDFPIYYKAALETIKYHTRNQQRITKHITELIAVLHRHKHKDWEIRNWGALFHIEPQEEARAKCFAGGILIGQNAQQCNYLSPAHSTNDIHKLHKVLQKGN